MSVCMCAYACGGSWEIVPERDGRMVGVHERPSQRHGTLKSEEEPEFGGNLHQCHLTRIESF